MDVTNQTWEQAARTGVTPDTTGTLKVKMDKLTGRAGGMAADTGELFYSIEIKLIPGTNKIITSYPAN